MKKVTYILFILICFLKFSSNGQSKGNLKIVGRALQTNGILLRWSPDTSKLWKLGNQYGYTLTRTTIKRNGVTLGVPENKQTYPINIASEIAWKAIVLDPLDPTKMTDSVHHAMMAGVIFGDVDYSDTTSEASNNKVRMIKDPNITNPSQEELEQKYDMAMLTADMKYSVAKMAALGYSDLTTLNNEVYRYKITSNVPVAILSSQGITAKADSIDIGATDYYVYPKLPKLKATVKSKSIELNWQIKNTGRNVNLERHYVAYSILGSKVAGSPVSAYKTLNKQLLVSITDGDTIPMNYIDSDTSLKVGNKRYYLLKGKSLFDEETVTLDSLSEVTYTEKTSYFPKIIKAARSGSTEGNYVVKWEFLPPIVDSKIDKITNIVINDTIVGKDTTYTEIRDAVTIPVSQYIVKRSNTYNGVYTNAMIVNGTVDSVIVTQIKRSTYFKVVVVSPTYGTIESTPILVQPKDDTPPQKPITVNGVVNKDNIKKLQLAKITWKRNEKAYPEDADIAGYRVFRANRLTDKGLIEEPSQITDSIHVWKPNSDSLTISFVDTLEANALSLNPKIYYIVQAFDKRYNHSIFSDSVVISNPNKAKPSQPLFKSFQVTKEGINLTWIRSNDNTTPTKHILVRLEEPFELQSTINPLDNKYFNTEADTIYLDKKVSGETTYAYYVCAIVDEDTVLSNPLIIDVPGSVIDQVVNLTFSLGASRINNQVELKWTINSNKTVSNYEIYKGVGNNQVTSWKVMDGYDLATNDLDPIANYLYRYSIRALFTDGTSSPWQNAQIVFPDVCVEDAIIIRKASLEADTIDEACEMIELKPGFDSKKKNTTDKKQYKTKLPGQL
jgi:uncharacterized protein